MMPRCLSALTVLSLAACGDQTWQDVVPAAPPGQTATSALVVLTSEIPGLQVFRVRSLATLGDRSSQDTLPHRGPSQALDFPITYAVVPRSGTGMLAVQVDALDSGGQVVGRAMGSVELQAHASVQLPLLLRRPCDNATQCQDATYCNGEETCVDGMCGQGIPPCDTGSVNCVQVTCLEREHLCSTVAHHERCASTSSESVYCDLILGCSPGAPCDADVTCDNALKCDGVEACVAGRCVAGTPPEVDDLNPCTLDACSEAAGGSGEAHVPVPQGNTCPQGICVDGACVQSACGDHVVDTHAGERCDNGGFNSDTLPDACRTTCQPAHCGDGTVDTGEECDDGALSGGGCLAGCLLNVCGDGVVNPALEECDDGNLINEDPCLNACRANVCGDGVRNIQGEDCDDGNTADGDGCLSTCSINVCGDGFLNPAREVCDDGNNRSGDGCEAQCRRAEVCGDGIQDPQEACDDANTNPMDGCDQCRLTRWNVATLSGLPPTQVPPLDVPLNRPGPLALGADGSLHVADESQRIWTLPPGQPAAVTLQAAGGAPVPLSPALWTPATSLSSLKTQPDGSLRVGTRAPGRILGVLDNVAALLRAGTVPNSPDPTLTQLGAVVGMLDLSDGSSVLVDGAGCVLVVAAGRAYPVGLNGVEDNLAWCGLGVWQAPSGAAADAQDCVYVADAATHAIFRLPLGACTQPAEAVAGTPGTAGYSGDGAPAQLATLRSPGGLVVEASGRVLVADTGNNVVRAFTPGGTITTVAGTGRASWLGGSGPATSTPLWHPSHVLAAPDGFYVSDTGNHRVVHVDATGQAATVLGRGFPEGGVAPNDLAGDVPHSTPLAVNSQNEILTAARGRVVAHGLDGHHRVVAGALGEGTPLDGELALGIPLNTQDLVLDASDHLYFSDADALRRVGDDGRVVTVGRVREPTPLAGVTQPGHPSNFRLSAGSTAGVSTWVWTMDATGNFSSIPNTHLVLFDCPENDPCYNYVAPAFSFVLSQAPSLWVVNSSRLFQLTPQGVATPVTAAGGVSVDGPLATASLASVRQAGAGAAPGDWLLMDGSSIRRLDLTAGSLTTLATSNPQGLGNLGSGPLTGARFDGVALAEDPAGNVYFGDSLTQGVQRISPGGTLTRILGATQDPPGDGPLASAHVRCAFLGSLPGGDLLCAEYGRLRVISLANQTVTTVMGRAAGLYNVGTSAVPCRDVAGQSINAMAIHPTMPVAYLVLGSSLAVVEGLDLAPAQWTVRLLAQATRGDAEGALDHVSLYAASGLLVDAAHQRLLVSDRYEHVVRSIRLDDPAAPDAVQVVAGTWGRPGLRDGPAPQALFREPHGLALHPDGSILVADAGNNVVRRLASDGNVVRVLGTGAPVDGPDGAPARFVSLLAPLWLDVDATGNVFVATQRTLRLVTGAAGNLAAAQAMVITVLAGNETSYPEAAVRCLVPLRVPDGLWVSDTCSGLLMHVTRMAQ